MSPVKWVAQSSLHCQQKPSLRTVVYCIRQPYDYQGSMTVATLERHASRQLQMIIFKYTERGKHG